MNGKPARGFILHPTYRLEASRPVVHLFGRLEDGRSFLVRDRSLAPYFFVRAQDAEAARSHGTVRQSATRLTSMRGEPLVRLEVDSPEQVPPIRDALARAGVVVLEADVRFAMRHLIDHGIKGAVEIEPRPSGGRTAPGPAGSRGPQVDALFDDPAIRPSDFHPTTALLRVLSIDLETDPRGERIDSAALVGAGVEEVLLALSEDALRAGMGEKAAPCRVVPCGDEKGLLRTLFARMREIDFDVLTGWNVIDFDLEVLV